MSNNHRAYDRPEDVFSPEEIKRSSDMKVKGISNQLKRIQAMENGIPTLSKRKSDNLLDPEIVNEVATSLTLKNIDPNLISRLGDMDRNERAGILAHMWSSIEQDKININNLLELAQDQFATFGSDPQALVLAHHTYSKYAELISSFDRELVKLTNIIMTVRAQWDAIDMADSNQEESYESFAERASNIRPDTELSLDIQSDSYDSEYIEDN